MYAPKSYDSLVVFHSGVCQDHYFFYIFVWMTFFTTLHRGGLMAFILDASAIVKARSWIDVIDKAK